MKTLGACGCIVAVPYCAIRNLILMNSDIKLLKMEDSGDSRDTNVNNTSSPEVVMRCIMRRPGLVKVSYMLP
jgi:hypothetical protein